MPATKTASATRATLDAYYIARAERTGVAVPALFHISFNIAGRTVSDKVRGINGAYARLDLLVEQAEAEELTRTRRIVLADNCKVREVEELSPEVRSWLYETSGRARFERWGC